MRLRVLTWNLMHGRSQPGARRDLLPEFTSALAGWDWDVALLQEVPPWWPAELARGLGAEYRSVRTSRNGLLPVRRAVAVRWPDLIRSNGGGANAILARQDRIVTERSLRLRRLPERRWMHTVRLAAGTWVANLHASGQVGRAERDCRLAATTALEWTGGEPLVFGGDLNLRAPTLAGLAHVAERDVDHLFVDQQAAAVGPPTVIDRGSLSDHPPLYVEVDTAARGARRAASARA